MKSLTEQFRDAIRASGLTPPNVIEADGKLHRFASNGKPNDGAGWYILYGDDIPAGSFGDWRTGLKQKWRANIGRTLTSSEEEKFRIKIGAMQREREAEETQRHAEAQVKAKKIWEESQPAPDDHPFLKKKGIKSHGVKIDKDSQLVIPMRSKGELHSLQFIDADGSKKFLYGGRIAFCNFIMGKFGDVICIAESFSTAATIHAITGHATVVAFSAGNLQKVAVATRFNFHNEKIILCADDDFHLKKNTGLIAARKAASSVGGRLAIPTFGVDRPDGATDFNDLAKLCGPEAVKGALLSALKRDAQHLHNQKNEGESGPKNWRQPQPLTVKVKSEPYPVDALPNTIREAVAEVAAFVQAPLPLVASSALSALSLVGQALADVQRDEILFGPTSLFLLGIADSGQRKTQADKMFIKPIQDYQDEQAEAGKIIWATYKADFEAWESKRGGIKYAIRQSTKKGSESTADLEERFRELEKERPEPPRIPKLIREDATPEGLAKKLQKDWPSAGVVSNEAGIVFGAHGMSKESVMRNLALLNKLWDGGRYQSDRGDEERSRDVRGARLTMGLMIQEVTLRTFFDQSKGLARGSGFLARFIISWPDSTMGSRFYTPPIEGSPALSKFNQRITELLNQPVPINENGILTPPILVLTTEAKSAWVTFHDAIEAQLCDGGELHDIRDVASKTADNAVRLAALFQLFEGATSAIGVDAFESAGRIVTWHLTEARRFFGELALPIELVNAARLDFWLIEYCKRKQTHLVGKNHTRQHGPLRNGAALDNAIHELEDLDRIQLVKDKKPLTIKVNPTLLLNKGAA